MYSYILKSRPKGESKGRNTIRRGNIRRTKDREGGLRKEERKKRGRKRKEKNKPET
jgi:hypothetical protein